MKVKITHYPDTVSARGYFYPSGKGVAAETLSASPGEDGTLTEWDAEDGTRVRIVQRTDKRGENLYCWVSTVDADGVEHTIEVERGYSHFAFGSVEVAISG
jgi:hypothetical protein